MNQLNYHHLKYFWMVAKEGSIVRASEALHVAQSTISGQLRELEETLREKLFIRMGRRLVLTETGRVVYRYAHEIFSLGEELVQTLQGTSPAKQQASITIGMAEAVPKLVVRELITAVLELSEELQVHGVEGRLSHLLAQLAHHRMELVIADAPVPETTRMPAINHPLGESGITLCATRSLAARHRRGFPRSLDGAPILLPTSRAAVRRELDSWLDLHRIEPRVRGVFDDSALMKVVGQSGCGMFFVPTLIEGAVKKQYGVQVVGRIDEVRMRFYAISMKRRFNTPLMDTILQRARKMQGARSTAGTRS
jgi:LysR family transcriptional activator of nhaA